MEWYGPLTIMPAIGLIIMSTSNFTVGLISEIERLEMEEDRDRCMNIIVQKLKQLRLLSVAISLLYAAILFFLFASLSNLFVSKEIVFNLLMAGAVISTTTAMTLLFIYSLKATTIRQQHLKL